MALLCLVAGEKDISSFHGGYDYCSDGTLNPNGVRFGSAEIYNIGESVNCGSPIRYPFASVESFSEVQDSLCVSQSLQAGLEERVVLFLKMSGEHE